MGEESHLPYFERSFVEQDGKLGIHFAHHFGNIIWPTCQDIFRSFSLSCTCPRLALFCGMLLKAMPWAQRLNLASLDLFFLLRTWLAVALYQRA